MEDLPSVPTWQRGRVVLVGDAAHATSLERPGRRSLGDARSWYGGALTDGRR